MNRFGLQEGSRLETNFSRPPAWAAESVFYQIFPDRFCNGNSQNDPQNIAAWNDAPNCNNFFGGDLEGIMAKLPYLKELGVTAIYLNPVFDSPSNHKYNATDYLKIAPEFGDLATFKKLVAEVHRLDMKIILDGVFNHTGDTFRAFRDVLEYGEKSRFKNWYHFHGFPVQQGQEPNYECWWNFGSLPKLNHDNPEVIRYLLKVVTFWMSTGIDGWRLDVPNEVKMDFWRVFRKLVKSINSEAFIVGEIWDDAHQWLTGDTCDAVMNYCWRDAVIQYFAHNASTVNDFRNRLSINREGLPWEYTLSAYNLLGSHDTPRFLTMCGGDCRKVLVATAFQYTYPGIPTVYYGDEIGLTGGKDPECRKTMKWNPREQNQELLESYRKLGRLRREHSALRTGKYYDLPLNDEIFAFIRYNEQERILVCVNGDRLPHRLDLPLEWREKGRLIYSLGELNEGILSASGFRAFVMD